MSNIDLLKLQSLLDDHRHYLLQGYNVVSNPYLRTEDIQMSNTILDKDKLNEKFPGNSFYKVEMKQVPFPKPMQEILFMRWKPALGRRIPLPTIR